MTQELLIYVIATGIGCLLSIFLSMYSFLKIKDAPGARYYCLATLMTAIFTFAYAFELSSSFLEQMKFWLMIEYFALPFIPVFILLMCYDYVGQKVHRVIYYLLFIIPSITIFIHNTNDYHHLYYKSMTLSTDSPFPTISLEGGPWFYVHSLFLGFCIIISIVILLMQFKKELLFRFRIQILTMVAGLMIPIVSSIFYINGMSPYGIDMGPVSMSISFLFHGIALVSFQMFNVAPIAKDSVFASMTEGVIVLNQNKMIVDYNVAMLKIMPILNTSMIGKPLQDILVKEQALANIIAQEQECDYEYNNEGNVKHYHIRFSPILNQNKQHIGQITTFIDITERVNLQEQLELLASMDGLTQVYNRTYFLKEADHIVKALQNERGPLAVMMFDIDNFKKVNDTFGHEAGDLVIAYVANVAKATLRDKDIIGRYGGEEFTICMPETSLIEAWELADIIRIKISESYVLYNGKKIRVTSSFGISNAFILEKNKNLILSTLMRQADEALYAAKTNGRNCVQSYNEAV